MEVYSNLLKLSEEAYQNSYKLAIECYNKLSIDISNFDTTQTTESNKQPMHPNLYYQLINVSGFCELNGNNYEEYIDKWKIRSNKTIEDQPTK